MPIRHSLARVDVLAACRALVAVAERGSFTVGAAAVGVPQSVASRRIAALEAHLGERLFDRSSRQVVLTRFGRDVLPAAQRLVGLAEQLEDDARRARQRSFGLAVPATCATVHLAHLVAEARIHGLRLDVRVGLPPARADLVRSLDVRAALVSVPPDEGLWSVPLGLAGTTAGRGATMHLELLRTGRSDLTPVRRVWVQPEDDVPHVRNRVLRLRDELGLLPSQVVVARDLTSAAAEVLGSSDLLLCSPRQAEELGLHWSAIGEAHLVRNYDVAAALGDDAVRVRTTLWNGVARCLGG